MVYTILACFGREISLAEVSKAALYYVSNIPPHPAGQQ